MQCCLILLLREIYVDAVNKGSKFIRDKSFKTLLSRPAIQEFGRPSSLLSWWMLWQTAFIKARKWGLHSGKQRNHRHSIDIYITETSMHIFFASLNLSGQLNCFNSKKNTKVDRTTFNCDYIRLIPAALKTASTVESQLLVDIPKLKKLSLNGSYLGLTFEITLAHNIGSQTD